MSQFILDIVKKAEAEAETIRKTAQDEARNILRSVEEARSQEERAAAAKRREEVNGIMQKQSEITEKEIEKLKSAHSAKREAVRKAAESRIPLAVDRVLEGLMNGNR